MDWTATARGVDLESSSPPSHTWPETGAGHRSAKNSGLRQIPRHEFQAPVSAWDLSKCKVKKLGLSLGQAAVVGLAGSPWKVHVGPFSQGPDSHATEMCVFMVISKAGVASSTGRELRRGMAFWLQGRGKE